MEKARLTRSEVLTQFRTGSIIDAAVSLAKREGLACLTMEGVAEEAGVAKGTIYLYFKDKDTLIVNAFQSVMALAADKVEQHLRGCEGDLSGCLSSVAGVLYKFAKEFKDFFYFPHKAAGWERFSLEGSLIRDLLSAFNRMVDSCAEYFSAATAKGEVIESDPRLLAVIFLKSLHAILLKGMDTDDRDVRGDAEFFIDIFINGISSSRRSKQ